MQSRYYDPAIGRFLNADALVSTGTGVLGCNMFAYCNNDPVNSADFSGYLPYESNIASDRVMTCDASNHRFRTVVIPTPTILLSEDALNFLTNTDEAAVQQNLKDFGFSFYKGAPVFMVWLPFGGTAFSFGIIVMDDYYANAQPEDFSNVLKHERGHTTHFSQIGASTYFETVAIPSLIGAGLAYVSPFILESLRKLAMGEYCRAAWRCGWILFTWGNYNRGYILGIHGI